MCSSMKQPKPDRFVVTLGIPITVHSALFNNKIVISNYNYYPNKNINLTNLVYSPMVHNKMEKLQDGNLLQILHNPLLIED